MTNMVTSHHKYPCPGVMKIIIWYGLPCSEILYTQSLEKDFLINNAFSLYNWEHKQKNPCPEVIKSMVLVNLSFVQYTHCFVSWLLKLVHWFYFFFAFLCPWKISYHHLYLLKSPIHKFYVKLRQFKSCLWISNISLLFIFRHWCWFFFSYEIKIKFYLIKHAAMLHRLVEQSQVVQWKNYFYYYFLPFNLVYGKEHGPTFFT